MALLLQGRPVGALQEAVRFPSELARLPVESMALYATGDAAGSDEKLQLAVENGLADSLVAEVHAWRGEIDEAFTALEAAIEKDFKWAGMSIHPFYEPMHSDPRWASLMVSLGYDWENQAKE